MTDHSCVGGEGFPVQGREGGRLSDSDCLGGVGGGGFGGVSLERVGEDNYSKYGTAPCMKR